MEDRGKFYEEVGAIRDVVQNHMLQVVACLAMGCPTSDEHGRCATSGGSCSGRSARSARPTSSAASIKAIGQEPGVAADSQVETYAAVEFRIETERWSGVPFFVRVGKRIPLTVTEVLVRFKHTDRPVLDEVGPPLANYFRFQLAPEVLLALGTKVKRPGNRLAGERIELVAHHQRLDEMLPYQRLLTAAAGGDPTLFARQDAVEESWRIVDPILGNVTPLHEYPAGIGVRRRSIAW